MAPPGQPGGVTLHSLPLFVRLAGRPVILLGEGEAADAKRRLLERAGAAIVGEDADAALAIVALKSDEEAEAAVARLRARGMLVNAVDRPALCDFTLPAIIDRAPVLVAIGTGGVSAGLAAALRQRLEAILPAGLGRIAERLHAARDDLRVRYPDAGERRRAIAGMLAEGRTLDLLCSSPSGASGRSGWEPHRSDTGLGWGLFAGDSLGETSTPPPTPPLKGRGEVVPVTLHSPDPDDLTLRQARALANADRVIHTPDVPVAILDRARADAERVVAPAEPGAGLTVILRMGTSA